MWEGLDMHKPWLVLSWFCDLESPSSASLQPITKKQKPENQPSVHTHKKRRRSAQLAQSVLLCDIVLCF
jgi:hypothetical protein